MTHITQPKRTGADEWYTPGYIVEACGNFDLDPCAASDAQYHLAPVNYTKADDGLSKEWSGRVWLNPPYSQPLQTLFIERLIAHGNGIALIPLHTDNRMWQNIILPAATAIFFIRRRIAFTRPDAPSGGTSPYASVLVAFDNDNAEALKRCGLKGVFKRLSND